MPSLTAWPDDSGMCSFDVGVGLASRRLRDQFLATFQAGCCSQQLALTARRAPDLSVSQVTYALKPVGQDASLFRAYPDQWKVFVADAANVGRYKLAAQMASPPPRACPAHSSLCWQLCVC